MSATFEANSAIAVLGQLLGRVLDPVPFLDYAGVSEVKHIRERITTTKTDPEGNPWIPWTRYTASLRDAKGNASQGIMWDSGDLLFDVHFNVDGAFGVDIGSDLWYAENQQMGLGKLPIREIFGWEPDRLLELEQAFLQFLEGGTL